MDIRPEDIREFRSMIFSWWKDNARDLPWRHTRDPYRILVSEVMLQQTQVSRVLPKYESFLSSFPTVQALASASTSSVLIAWKGLGYNKRALHLKHAAEDVVEKYSGKFPDSEPELIKLSGMGKYTARAVLVFAYEYETAMVDTNIRKIITHYFYGDQPRKESVIQETADVLLPKGRSWEWHQALMDYGALALPGIVPKKKRTIAKQPFRESDRFIRGRILDLLRDASRTQDDLLAVMREQYGKDKPHILHIMEALRKDGLIRIEGAVISLP